MTIKRWGENSNCDYTGVAKDSYIRKDLAAGFPTVERNNGGSTFINLNRTTEITRARSM